MPRDGAFILSDVRGPTLSIVCEPCGRHETYNVARLMEGHGDAKMTDLLQTLAKASTNNKRIAVRGRAAGWGVGIPDRGEHLYPGWHDR